MRRHQISDTPRYFWVTFYVYRDEPGHEEAVQLLDSAGKSITHSYVLAELVALAKFGVTRV